MIELNDVFAVKTKPRKCPNCGSRRIADVHCGPMYRTGLLLDEISEEKVVVRPHCFEGPVPSWECRYCGMEIHKEADVEMMSLF